MEQRRVVIVGNGIAGVTAARHLRKRTDDAITIVSGETDYFFSRTALMYVYMGHMTERDIRPYDDGFWDRNRIRLRRAWVERVDTAHRRLELSGGSHLEYDVLILACGSRSNKFGWPGQDLHGVQGLYSWQDLQTMEADTQGIERGVVVGGGLIGIETAEMLRSRGIDVSFIVRERSWMDAVFRAPESAMINRQIVEHGVDLRLGTEIEAIRPDESGRARAATLKGGGEIDCGFVALTIGVSPNIAFLRDSGIECDRGILVDGRLGTSAADVYAVGDCAQLRRTAPGRRAIEPIWYVGRRMGETVARTLADEPTEYDPGIWFNSAKFFDLEWQIYGQVPAEIPEGHASVYWEHGDGKRAIRIDYRTEDEAVTGFNLMGVRYRHELCERWLREATPVREVLADLGAANFDPELYAQHESELIAVWNREHPDRPVRQRRRRGATARPAGSRAS